MRKIVLLAVMALTLAGCQTAREDRILGGSLIGLSFATFWMAARSITNPARRGIAVVLGVAKVSLFLGLSAAVLSGRVVADADGFAQPDEPQ